MQTLGMLAREMYKARLKQFFADKKLYFLLKLAPIPIL